MGTRLLCWVVLGFLGTDHTGAGVSQSPRYKVTKRGQDVALRCDPISGHDYLYWYQQALGQGPELLTYFNYEAQQDKSGLPNDRFSADRPEGSVSTLKIQRTEQRDSAVYLCASSLATAWHGRLLPVHKPRPSFSLQLQEPLTFCLSLLLTFHGKEVDLDIGCPLGRKRPQISFLKHSDCKCRW
uniref:Ig-like domain-containing protein n=1 Tax=Papio anubis TaxID=9555 RepID=A0A8I5NHP5_PAPAN